MYIVAIPFVYVLRHILKSRFSIEDISRFLFGEGTGCFLQLPDSACEEAFGFAVLDALDQTKGTSSRAAPAPADPPRGRCCVQ